MAQQVDIKWSFEGNCKRVVVGEGWCEEAEFNRFKCAGKHFRKLIIWKLGKANRSKYTISACMQDLKPVVDNRYHHVDDDQDCSNVGKTKAVVR